MVGLISYEFLEGKINCGILVEERIVADGWEQIRPQGEGIETMRKEI